MELSPDTVSLILNGYHNNLRMSQSCVSQYLNINLVARYRKKQANQIAFFNPFNAMFTPTPTFIHKDQLDPSPTSLKH